MSWHSLSDLVFRFSAVQSLGFWIWLSKVDVGGIGLPIERKYQTGSGPGGVGPRVKLTSSGVCSPQIHFYRSTTSLQTREVPVSDEFFNFFYLARHEPVQGNQLHTVKGTKLCSHLQ